MNNITSTITRFVIFLLILNTGCTNNSNSNKELQSAALQQKAIETIEEIPVPETYFRDSAKTAFGTYLRTLKLKPKGTLVTYYNGGTKANNDIYEYVVDLEIGAKDLHQCADAIMRLRAEHFWNQKEFDKIHFNFTNGFQVDYSEWMKGRRMVVEGNHTYWNNKSNPSNTYQDFWDYMELIFTYAGTASLEKEMNSINLNEAELGDVLIQGGHPGHAVIIVDKAINTETGKSIYLLAQSYMPAQDLQILKNRFDSSLSPWYELKEGDIRTSEWGFTSGDLKRFAEE